MHKLTTVLDPETLREKKDEDAQARIGRTFDLDRSFLQEGRRAFLFCVYPDFNGSLDTSRVETIISGDDHVTIITRNSIYFLEEVEE